MFGSGNASSTSSLVSSIDFSPVLNFGKDNSAGIDKINEQTATVSPRQDNSTTASVGVGVAGGSGSGGAVQRIQDENTAVSSLPNLSHADKQKLLYFGLAAAGVTGVYFLAKKKKK